MGAFLDYLLLFLSQFAGGPGCIENNLMRFGLPAVMWAVLLVVAWSRQRESKRPREQWLVWGFGLALARELFMFTFVSLQIIGVIERGSAYFISAPLERALTMAALVVIAGSFLRYILDDEPVARRYMNIGLIITLLCYLATFWWWAGYSLANPGARFGQTWAAWLFHGMSALLIFGAMSILHRKEGWLRNVMMVALSFFLISDVLMLVNMAFGETYTFVLCPISHAFYILAIPMLGYVYIHETSLERKQALAALLESEQHFRDIIENTDAGYFFIAGEGCIQQVNEAWLQMHGYGTAAEVIGRPYAITRPDGTAEDLQGEFTGVAGGPIPASETMRITKDGTLKYHTSSFNPVIQSGRVTGIEGFLIDRTDQVSAEAEIQRRNEQVIVLRELDRLRSELIANVSHDLRTPLGLIKLSGTSLLATDVAFDEDIRDQMLGVILDEAERLENLVDDLLLLSQAEGGRLDLYKQNMPADVFIAHSLSGLEAAVERHEIAYDVAPPSLMISIDPNRMAQVLRNLISNAVKYSPQGGMIRIEARASDDAAVLTVADQGIGIPEGELERVFDRFYRLDNPITRNIRGAGLGLAVCKNMVEAHGGHIWVESEVDQGSTFFVAIPYEAAQEVEAQMEEMAAI